MRHLISGAKWWKFDFHTHTPASMDYREKELSPREWLLACMKAGIDCVAITDHNTGDWIEKLRNELRSLKNSEVKPEEYRDLYLFPGVEITANNGVHILAIFDPESPQGIVDALLGKIEFRIDKKGTSDAVTTFSPEKVISEIHNLKGVAIPAHVDQSGGIFTVLIGTTLRQLLEVDNLLAIELKDIAYKKPDIYTQSRPNLSEVIGSDSHHPNTIGQNFTWIKMSNPSISALKLALHDGEDGIIRCENAVQDPNSIQNRYFIKSLRVSNGFTLGNGTPLQVEFSPWLTSIIGGRGSGKSTVINFLRIALDRKSGMPDEIQSEFDKFNKIGERNKPGMLRANTCLEVKIVKDGKQYLLFWEQGKQGKYTLQSIEDDESHCSDPIEITNINELFPVHIFNQKELYTLTNDTSKLLELIDSQFEKNKWKEEKESLVSDWLDINSKYRRLKETIKQEANIRAQLQMLQNEVKNYEEGNYKDILNKYKKLTEVKSFFDELSTIQNERNQKLGEVKGEFEKGLPTPPEYSFSNDDREYIEKVRQTNERVKELLTEASNLLAESSGLLYNQRVEQLSWSKEYSQVSYEFRNIQSHLRDLQIPSYDLLIKKKSELEVQLAQVVSAKEKLIEIENQRTETYKQIIEKEKELREQRRNVIARWSQIYNPENTVLSIELKVMGNLKSSEKSFREIIRKTGGEFERDILTSDDSNNYSGIIARIADANDDNKWDTRREELRKLLRSDESNKNGFDLRFIRHISELKQKTPEDIDKLMIWTPEDEVILKLNKGGILQDISTGSAGERTAGMLGLLLALNDNPLIIDQPEDDLDTRLISNFVVESFKKLKQNRQLIIVTHNPNITVNANSDNVLHMDFHYGQIVNAGCGALQEEKIRNAVCEIMEGGKNALEKRYYKISKALRNTHSSI
jgi:hypothetical protein